MRASIGIRLLALSLTPLLASACATHAGSVAAVRAELAPTRDARRPVLVVAHRGCWKETAENSLAAIARCIAIGVDIVELDVRRTRDGQLVLMHDATVDRTTNGTGAVADLTLGQIRSLRLRGGAGGAGAPLTNAAPPTFEEAMRAARGRILVNLDAKADVYDAAFDVLRKTGTVDHVIMKRRVKPGDPPLAAIAPFDRVFAMPIVDESAGPAPALLASQVAPAPVAVELIFTRANYLDDAAPIIAATGARIWVNALKDEFAAGMTDRLALQDPAAAWGRLVERGVTMIQTDEPRLLLDFLHRIGRRAGLNHAAPQAVR